MVGWVCLLTADSPGWFTRLMKDRRSVWFAGVGNSVIAWVIDAIWYPFGDRINPAKSTVVWANIHFDRLRVIFFQHIAVEISWCVRHALLCFGRISRYHQRCVGSLGVLWMPRPSYGCSALILMICHRVPAETSTVQRGRWTWWGLGFLCLVGTDGSLSLRRFGEYLCVFSCDVSYRLGWDGQLVSFTFDVPVEVCQIDAHTDIISSFLGCYYNGSAPLGGLWHGCDYALLFQALELCFQFLSVRVWYSLGGLDAEWLRIVYEGYVKLLSFHGFHLVIEYAQELVD